MNHVGKEAQAESDWVKQLSTTNESLRAFFVQTEEKLKKITAENKEILLFLGNDDDDDDDDEDDDDGGEAKQRDKDKEQKLSNNNNNINKAVVEDKANKKPKGNVKAVLSLLKGKSSDHTHQTETKPQTEKLKKELEECQSSLTQLKLQNGDLSSQLQLLRLELSEELKAKDADLSKVKKDLEKEREEERILQELLKTETKSQTKKLNKELEECQSSLTQLKLQNADLSSQFQLLKSEHSEQKRALTKVNNDLEKEGGEKRTLQEELKKETEKLNKELKECHSSLTQLKFQNQDLSSQLQFLNSKLSEQQKTKDEELKTHNSSLTNVKNDLEKERSEKRTLQEELKKCKELLDEYSESQLSLMEQTAELNDELQEVHGQLERVDSELTDKTYEGSELELELHHWKTTAERMKTQYEESQKIRLKLEASLLAQSQLVEMISREKQENDGDISKIEKQIVLLKDEDENAQICEDDQQEEEQLAGELKEAILAHIMKEKNYTQLPIVLELMRSELSDIGSNEQQLEEIEAKLMEQIERGSLAKTKSELEREHREKHTLQEEVNKYREMLDNSAECQLTIIEQACDTEKKLIDELQEVQGVLLRVDSELTDTTHERTELDLELELWKSTAERLQIKLEESQGIRKLLETCLIAQDSVNGFKNTAKIVNGDEQEQQSLEREPEQAILAHTVKERNYAEQSLVLKIMKSEFSETGGLDAQSKREKESSFSHLMKQLEIKNAYLAEIQAKLENECKEKCILKEELGKYKEMLDESSKSQLNIMQQAVEMETQLTDELLEVHDVLDSVDSQLTDKTNEGTELEFELQLWKSIAERLNVQVEESQGIRKKLEASLLAVQTEFEKIPKTEICRNYQTSPIQQIDDGDEKEQKLLAKELEQEIRTHIMNEKNCT